MNNGKLIIVSAGCKLDRKLIMRCKFSVNFIFNIKNRIMNDFNLAKDVIAKNIGKRVNISVFRRSNKIINLIILDNIMTHIGISFINWRRTLYPVIMLENNAFTIM